MEYKPIQSVFPCEDCYDITGPNDTQIVLYDENIGLKRSVEKLEKTRPEKVCCIYILKYTV